MWLNGSPEESLDVIATEAQIWLNSGAPFVLPLSTTTANSDDYPMHYPAAYHQHLEHVLVVADKEEVPEEVPEEEPSIHDGLIDSEAAAVAVSSSVEKKEEEEIHFTTLRQRTPSSRRLRQHSIGQLIRQHDRERWRKEASEEMKGGEVDKACTLTETVRDGYRREQQLIVRTSTPRIPGVLLVVSALLATLLLALIILFAMAFLAQRRQANATPLY
jgi:hypothetical protein